MLNGISVLTVARLARLSILYLAQLRIHFDSFRCSIFFWLLVLWLRIYLINRKKTLNGLQTTKLVKKETWDFSHFFAQKKGAREKIKINENVRCWYFRFRSFDEGENVWLLIAFDRSFNEQKKRNQFLKFTITNEVKWAQKFRWKCKLSGSPK